MMDPAQMPHLEPALSNRYRPGQLVIVEGKHYYIKRHPSGALQINERYIHEGPYHIKQWWVRTIWHSHRNKRRPPLVDLILSHAKEGT